MDYDGSEHFTVTASPGQPSPAVIPSAVRGAGTGAALALTMRGTETEDVQRVSAHPSNAGLYRIRPEKVRGGPVNQSVVVDSMTGVAQRRGGVGRGSALFRYHHFYLRGPLKQDQG